MEMENNGIRPLQKRERAGKEYRESLPRLEVFGVGKWQNGSSSNIPQNGEFVCMDWVERPHNYKGLYGYLQLLQGSHLENFPLKTLKIGCVAFHSL